MRKVTSHWVAHQLNDEQKQERLRICRQNLAKFRNCTWRLCDIITGDETWVHHTQISRKSSNATWVSENDPPRTIVRRNRFEPRKLFCFFFKSSGAVLIHKVDNGKTIDHNYYIEIVSRLLSMKYGNKKNHHTQNVSNCFMIMVDLVSIGMLLII
jgi:hypothetical protein